MVEWAHRCAVDWARVLVGADHLQVRKVNDFGSLVL